jgi:hypothetical protein
MILADWKPLPASPGALGHIGSVVERLNNPRHKHFAAQRSTALAARPGNSDCTEALRLLLGHHQGLQKL